MIFVKDGGKVPAGLLIIRRVRWEGMRAVSIRDEGEGWYWLMVGLWGGIGELWSWLAVDLWGSIGERWGCGVVLTRIRGERWDCGCY